jgi:hypothetical protein
MEFSLYNNIKGIVLIFLYYHRDRGGSRRGVKIMSSMKGSWSVAFPTFRTKALVSVSRVVFFFCF